MKVVQITGGSVTLRERSDLRVIDRQRLQSQLVDLAPQLQGLPVTDGELDVDAALRSGQLTGKQITAIFELTKAAIVARVAAWTLDRPLPKQPEDLDDLNAEVWDELSVHVSDGLMELLNEVSFDPSNPRAEGFLETPTQP